MRIAILGCGAMGTILGAYLQKGGVDVEMIDSYEAHVKALNEKGATVMDKENFTVPVHAILPSQMEGIYDLVFLMTKQTTNDVVLPHLLPHLGPDSIVCTMQNGVPEPFVAEYVGEARTMGASMHWGATFVSPGCSELTTDLAYKREHNEHFFELGEMNGEVTPRLLKVAEILETMGMVKYKKHIRDARWTKIVINCCGTGMSAACGSNFGGLIASERAMECMSFIAYEVAVVAKAANINIGRGYFDILFHPAKARAFYNSIYVQGPEGKGSMLQDLEKGRKTEVDMINGVVAAMGDRLGIDTPFNDAVIRIVHGIENGSLPLSMGNLKLFPDVKYEDRDE